MLEVFNKPLASLTLWNLGEAAALVVLAFMVWGLVGAGITRLLEEDPKDRWAVLILIAFLGWGVWSFLTA